MMQSFAHNRPIVFSALAILFFWVSATVVICQDKDWRPFTPEELQMKTPKVEPDADAEAIFWEVRIDDSSSEDLSRKHYVRVKIFTERGREKYSKFDIPFTKGTKIKDLAARIIKADGSIVEIGKADIFEREIVKASGVKIKAKSFAVPNIEPGVIIEYKYKETTDNAGAIGLRLQFQRDIPVQTLSYYYKTNTGNEPRYQPYNFTDVKFVKDKNGFYLAQRNNVSSLKEEPNMPPDDMVRPWMLLTGTRISFAGSSGFTLQFSIRDPSVPTLYWGAVATDYSFLTKFMNKSSGEIKKAAEEAAAGAQTPEDKLKKLYEYCQTQIANTSFDKTLTDEQRAKLPEVKSMADVLKRHSGSSQFVDMLFGAMANSLGMESRIALVADRSQMFFHPKMTNDKLIHPGAIGVKVGNVWKVLNPGSRYAPYGLLPWYEEDTWALLVGEKEFSWQETPLAGYDRSQTKRTGKFVLLDDGTLEGDVVLELSGQPALGYRLENYDESATKRETDLKDEVKVNISAAEVSNVAIENLDDATKPLVKHYHVRVPNYAQKTGKRLFLQPGYFEYGKNAVFSSSERKYDIFFKYPSSDIDKVEIALPKDFDLDNADAPGVIEDRQKIGSDVINITIDRANSVLRYDRKFHFGGGGNVLFVASTYPLLKNLFDEFHKADSHSLSLKQK